MSYDHVHTTIDGKCTNCDYVRPPYCPVGYAVSIRTHEGMRLQYNLVGRMAPLNDGMMSMGAGAELGRESEKFAPEPYSGDAGDETDAG